MTGRAGGAGGRRGPPGGDGPSGETPQSPPSTAALAAHHLSGSKPRERWGVGVEVEKFAHDARTQRRIPYDGAVPSIRQLLEWLLEARPSRALEEDGRLIALDGDWGTITLEPGGQIEWSSALLPDFDSLAGRIRDHLEILGRAGEALGIRFPQLALEPATPLEEMPWMPKQRYDIMREHFRRRGRLAHRMMTQTASVQVSVDFSDEEDWREKFRAGFLLAPIVAALFANSRVLEGRDTGYASYRTHIWRHTDDQRCGAPPFVFREEFGMADWVEWLLDMPMMLIRRGNRLASARATPFRRLLAGGWEGRPVTLEDWHLHVTQAFTEARTKTYIELRSADLPADERLLAVPALWVGLLYDEEARAAAVELTGWGPGRRPTPGVWRSVMERVAREGLAARLSRRPVRDLAREAVSLARAAHVRLATGAHTALDPLSF